MASKKPATGQTTGARPIIVIKKKSAHEGHHGGAWKVAYADFVTAMMAFFIVLWLMNSSKQVQDAVGGYFRDPSGTGTQTGTSLAGSGENFSLTKDNMEQLKHELEKSTRQITNFAAMESQVEMTVTAEGLRIELLETEAGTFFESGSYRPSPSGKELLTKLAEELGKLPNKIYIEGHTDSRPFARGGEFGNWELSTERANAARRVMQKGGVREEQTAQVRGYADRRLRHPDKPEEPSNRRISLIIQYVLKSGGAAAKEGADEKPEANREE
jgi:chemotaxis protein MotB